MPCKERGGSHMQLFPSPFLTFIVLTRVMSPCEVAELQSHLMNLWNSPLLNRGPGFQDIKGKIIPSRSPKNILMCLYWVLFSHCSLPLSYDWIKSSEEKKIPMSTDVQGALINSLPISPTNELSLGSHERGPSHNSLIIKSLFSHEIF